MDETRRQQTSEYSPEVGALAKQVGLHIARSSRFLLPRMNQELLTQSQAFVLHLLLADEQLWRLSDLATAAGVRLPSMTDLVARMERQGWVRKEGMTHDRRCVVITLTREGRAVIQDFERRNMHVIAQRLVTLSAADLATIARALPALERLLAAGDEQAE